MERKNEKLIIQDTEILEMDDIFEKISNKYKNKSDEYLLKTALDANLRNYIGKGKVKDEIKEGVFLNFDFLYCYIEKDNKKIFIDFLVKARFKDEEKRKFSFWVCSFNYLQEKLQSMGYKQAKINKKKLFPENEEQEDKGSNGSSSESLDNKNGLDSKLINYEVKVTKNIFSLENIFDESQKIFDPTINFENIEEYKKDINLPKTINKDKFKFNKNYITDLRDFMNNEDGLYCYFYNEKSGLTLSLLQILEKNRELINTRYFYFNSEYIKKYGKKYFYFRIAKIFNKEEKKLFLELLKPEKEDIINYNSEYISKILNKILKELKDVHIIFDNIQDQITFYKIMDIMVKMNQNTEFIEIKEKSDKVKNIGTNKIRLLNNYTLSLFFPINHTTLKLINSSNIYSSNISFLFPDDNSYTQELTPTEYFNSLVQDNYDKEKYKNKIRKEISEFIDDNDNIEYLIFLIELLHLKRFMKNKSLIYYDENNYLVKFLPYLYISLNIELGTALINKIKFRTNFIEEIIYDQINYLLSQKIITDDIFKYIKTKPTEGIYIEKQIIYYLITKIINFQKVKIEKIYCFDSILDKKIINNNNNNNRIIFIQKSETAPLYDFGVIIYINGKPIFKGYQIGINKPLNSLLQLYKEKIKMDLLYFIYKINNFLNEKITEFSFGIITTKYAYDSQKNNNNINNNCNNDFEIDKYDDINEDKKEEENDKEYKNYNSMKTYCNDNNYEFLIFDPKNNKFFIDKDNNLENIVFHDYYENKFKNIVSNYIFKNEENYNLTKLPIFPNEITKTDKEYIRNSINEAIKDKQLNFVGKFQKEESIKIDFNNLINDNFIIYSKDKDKKKSIFFKKEYLCDDCKDSNIFYIFDISLDKIKKIRKKDITILQNKNLFICCNIDDNNEKNKIEKTFLKKKTLRYNEENDEEKDNDE